MFCVYSFDDSIDSRNLWRRRRFLRKLFWFFSKKISQHRVGYDREAGSYKPYQL